MYNTPDIRPREDITTVVLPYPGRVYTCAHIYTHTGSPGLPFAEGSWRVNPAFSRCSPPGRRFGAQARRTRAPQIIAGPRVVRKMTARRRRSGRHCKRHPPAPPPLRHDRRRPAARLPPARRFSRRITAVHALEHAEYTPAPVRRLYLRTPYVWNKYPDDHSLNPYYIPKPETIRRSRSPSERACRLVSTHSSKRS